MVFCFAYTVFCQAEVLNVSICIESNAFIFSCNAFARWATVWKVFSFLGRRRLQCSYLAPGWLNSLHRALCSTQTLPLQTGSYSASHYLAVETGKTSSHYLSLPLPSYFKRHHYCPPSVLRGASCSMDSVSVALTTCFDYRGLTVLLCRSGPSLTTLPSQVWCGRKKREMKMPILPCSTVKGMH